ncbi:MAG: bifunctional phosphopantothenoylcysteine decarboxylase/phosphopantothenate--cysteine ligase CoaBC [Chloroflexota bacterium]|nr:bifunctional phosphopantothenoylcysteine decarboxylase/phosphopantothenate--cysteine ligase CoaBC [Chloroflexota bacterium]
MTASRTLAGRRIVVGVAGSIAAYKAVLVVRRLTDAGATVDVAMTHSATAFVGPLTFESLTRRPVVTDALALDPSSRIAHVELAEAADAVVLAPATAHLVAQLAGGLVPDAVTAIVAASRAPVIVAPAMDAAMWSHPATRRNVETLRSFGYRVVEPVIGPLASGLVGEGRLAEAEEIVRAVELVLARQGDLDGLRVLVSAGGTQEPIDPVRFVGNRSSGRMGVAIAETARDRGASVTLVHGAMTVEPPGGIDVRATPTAREMRGAIVELARRHDVLVMAAAVADYTPAQPRDAKIKRDGTTLRLELEPNPDIVAEVASLPPADRPFVVGFAAETGELAANAMQKLRGKGLDLVVANRVGGDKDAIGAASSRVTVFGADGELASWPLLPKTQVAARLWDLVIERYRSRSEASPIAPTAEAAERTRTGG